MSAIGHQVVFRLTQWSVQIHSRFLGPGATWDPSREAASFRLRGCHPLCRAIQDPSTMTRLSDSLPGRQTGLKGPTTPYAQRLPACTRARFGLIRFRSPLLTEYLFLPVLRCFTSRRSLHTPYIFRCGSYDMTRTGFPHSDILGSRFVCQLPEAYRRLQRPSSAPGAKASTLCPYQLDHKNQRCSRPLCSSQPTTRTHPVHPAHTPTKEAVHRTRGLPATRPPHHPRRTRTSKTIIATPRTTPANRLFPQDPTACRADPTPRPIRSHPHPANRARRTRTHQEVTPAIVDVPPVSTTPSSNGQGMGLDNHDAPMTGTTSCQMLLRKEVIQPHLPVRLPCYDLVLIASPTFDGSPPKVGPPASGVTDFHDLTGGVYKARERIHRSVADLRLLATPTSRGRVADPDPN